MREQLGIVVITSGMIKHLIGIARAAVAGGREVAIFFTGDGVLTTMEDEFEDLASLADISLCRASFEKRGLGRRGLIPELDSSSFTNQSRHADLIFDCDRYLVI